MLFVDLLSLHLATFLMYFIVVTHAITLQKSCLPIKAEWATAVTSIRVNVMKLFGTGSKDE